MARSPRDQNHALRSQPARANSEADRARTESFDRNAFSPALRYPELDRYPQERRGYRFHNQPRYFLRQSEIYTLAEVGKFRVLSSDDLEKYIYSGDETRMAHDLANLAQQGLIRKGFARYPETIRVVSLTRDGEKIMREVLKETKQEVYSGLKKARELRHDTALYEVYQTKAQEIEEVGGKIKRVILDYELKKKLNRDLQRAKDEASSEESRFKEEVGQRHQVPIVQGQFVVPDVRIEYEDREGNQCRVDLEYLTETYRHGDIASKAHAGFSLYSSHDQAPRLHRVLDQHQIMTEILSL